MENRDITRALLDGVVTATDTKHDSLRLRKTAAVNSDVKKTSEERRDVLMQ